ncbi:alpha/beta fold hydrolase [Fulvivirgaceae bacterium LMO-SS25]
MWPDLFHTDAGKGVPVVFLHGFCENLSIWNDFMPDIASNHRFVSIDLPGFGGSPLLENTTIENVGECVYQFLKNIGIDKCHIFGHSLGGYVALAIEEKHPEFTLSIGLIHSNAFADGEEKKINRNKSIEFIQKHGADTFLQTFVPSLFNPERREELQGTIQILSNLTKETSKETMLAYTAAMRDREDRSSLISQTNKAILFVAGAYDGLINMELNLAHKELIKNGEFHVLPNSGHVGMYEEPEKLLHIINNFIQELHDDAQSGPQS